MVSRLRFLPSLRSADSAGGPREEPWGGTRMAIRWGAKASALSAWPKGPQEAGRYHQHVIDEALVIGLETALISGHISA